MSMSNFIQNILDFATSHGIVYYDGKLVHCMDCDSKSIVRDYVIYKDGSLGRDIDFSKLKVARELCGKLMYDSESIDEERQEFY